MLKHDRALAMKVPRIVGVVTEAKYRAFVGGPVASWLKRRRKATHREAAEVAQCDRALALLRTGNHVALTELLPHPRPPTLQADLHAARQRNALLTEPETHPANDTPSD